MSITSILRVNDYYFFQYVYLFHCLCYVFCPFSVFKYISTSYMPFLILSHFACLTAFVFSALCVLTSSSLYEYPCMFQYVPPGGNTTFEVVFLARQVGNVENTLYIHTSQGSYKYQVRSSLLTRPHSSFEVKLENPCLLARGRQPVLICWPVIIVRHKHASIQS